MTTLKQTRTQQYWTYNEVKQYIISSKTNNQIMSRLEQYNDGYTWEKFLDARFPYKPKEQWLKTQKSIPKISEGYLKTNDFD